MDVKMILFGIAAATVSICAGADVTDDLRYALHPTALQRNIGRKNSRLVKLLEDIARQDNGQKIAGAMCGKMLAGQLGHELWHVRERAQSALEYIILREDEIGKEAYNYVKQAGASRDLEIGRRAGKILLLKKTVEDMPHKERKEFLSMAKPFQARKYLKVYNYIEEIVSDVLTWGHRIKTDGKKFLQYLEMLYPLSVYVLERRNLTRWDYTQKFPIPDWRIPRIMAYYEKKMRAIASDTSFLNYHKTSAMKNLIIINSPLAIDAWFTQIDSYKWHWHEANRIMLMKGLIQAGFKEELLQGLEKRRVKSPEYFDRLIKQAGGIKTPYEN